MIHPTQPPIVLTSFIFWNPILSRRPHPVTLLPPPVLSQEVLSSPVSRSPFQVMSCVQGGAERGPMVSAACVFSSVEIKPRIQKLSEHGVSCAVLPLSVLSLFPGQEQFSSSWAGSGPGHLSVPSSLSPASLSLLLFFLLSVFQVPGNCGGLCLFQQ